MPLKSKAQARKLFATNPKVAHEFASETRSMAKLPERVKTKPRPAGRKKGK